VMKTLEVMEASGARVEFCPLDGSGRVDFARMGPMVDERTALVCCMLVNNETGVAQDVVRLAALAHSAGALVFSDCVQALGKVPVDVRALGVDYASFSAHKVHGPKGVGALFARSGVPLAPLIYGGHQEGGRRAGTEGLHNIAGFGAACEGIADMLAAVPHVARLRDRLAEIITSLLRDSVVHTPSEHAVANTLSVTLPGIDASHAIALLDYHGIAVSAGSACNTEANEPSHVLKALGLSDDEARHTLRFSLSVHTTTADIRYVEKVLRTYLAGGELNRFPVTMISPSQLDEDMLSNEKLCFLDVRSSTDRKMLKGLPGSRETSLRALRNATKQIPRDRSIIVVCQAGMDSAMVAYYLRAKGFRDVSFVIGGIVGWKLAQPDVYRRLGNHNISPIDSQRGHGSSER